MEEKPKKESAFTTKRAPMPRKASVPPGLSMANEAHMRETQQMMQETEKDASSPRTDIGYLPEPNQGKRKGDISNSSIDFRSRSQLPAELGGNDNATLRDNKEEDNTQFILAKEKHHEHIYVQRAQMYDHQIEALQFIWSQMTMPTVERQGCVLAHEMGLGKTLVIIKLLVTIMETSMSPKRSISMQVPPDLHGSKTLILCPSGLADNWLDELRRWVPGQLLGEYFLVNSEKDSRKRLSLVQRWEERGGVLVLGYRMLVRLLDEFGDDIRPALENGPKIVIADEAQELKNPRTKVHAAMEKIQTTARVALTGTPLANSIMEYHSILDWVAPGFLGTRCEFIATFARSIKRGSYSDSSPPQRKEALASLKKLEDKVAPKIHRATTERLQDQLSVKREFILYLALTELQKDTYNRLVKETSALDDKRGQIWGVLSSLMLLLAHPEVFQMRLLEMQELSQSQPTVIHEVLSKMARCDANTYSPKIKVLLAILDEAKRVNDKVVVFSHSKIVLNYLEGIFESQHRKFSRLNGDTAVQKRQAMVAKFNAGHDEVFLISTAAGGVGLNVCGANRVVIFDFQWNPTHEKQAIGRAYRIGQAKPVFVYRLVFYGTYETMVQNQAFFKTQLASRVVDGKNPLSQAENRNDYMAPADTPTSVDTMAKQLHGQDAVLDVLLEALLNVECICRVVSADILEREGPDTELPADEETSSVTASVETDGYMRDTGGKIGIHIGHSKKEHCPVVAFFRGPRICTKKVGEKRATRRNDIAFLKPLRGRAIEVVNKYVEILTSTIEQGQSNECSADLAIAQAEREVKEWDRIYPNYLRK